MRRKPMVDSVFAIAQAPGKKCRELVKAGTHERPACNKAFITDLEPPNYPLNGLPPNSADTGFKAQNNTLAVYVNACEIAKFSARLDYEHATAARQPQPAR